MKKYLLGFFAVAIAVVGVAFTTPKQPQDIVSFKYTGPSTPTPTQLKDVTNNWVISSEECEDGTTLPCIVNHEESTFQSYLNSISDETIQATLLTAAASTRD